MPAQRRRLSPKILGHGKASRGQEHYALGQYDLQGLHIHWSQQPGDNYRGKDKGYDCSLGMDCSTRSKKTAVECLSKIMSWILTAKICSSNESCWYMTDRRSCISWGENKGMQNSWDDKCVESCPPDCIKCGGEMAWFTLRNPRLRRAFKCQAWFVFIQI